MNNNEESQQSQSLATKQSAECITISNNDSYVSASNVLRDIKGYAKRVADYWKPLKESAKKAHQAVCDKEKAILAPLSEAESIIKQKMVAYQQEQEAKEAAAKAEAERLRKEETERLLKQAQEAEESGNLFGADIALAQAELIESMQSIATMDKPKAEGVSTRKVWKATVIDSHIVPAEVNGIVIRPIDAGALYKLGQMSNGQANIPGVEFRQEIILSARGK